MSCSFPEAGEISLRFHTFPPPDRANLGNTLPHLFKPQGWSSSDGHAQPWGLPDASSLDWDNPPSSPQKSGDAFEVSASCREVNSFLVVLKSTEHQRQMLSRYNYTLDRKVWLSYSTRHSFGHTGYIFSLIQSLAQGYWKQTGNKWFLQEQPKASDRHYLSAQILSCHYLCQSHFSWWPAESKQSCWSCR